MSGSKTVIDSTLLSRLPQISTRKALLILDLQNDFVKPDGALFVENVPDFLDNVTALAQSFRGNGEVLWVQTLSEERRPIIDANSGSELIVIGKSESGFSSSKAEAEDIIPAHEAPSSSTGDGSLLSPQRRTLFTDDPEAFLSVSNEPGSRRCCLSNTTGFTYPAPVLAAIDHDRDTVLVKSDYSAFQSASLVQSFRAQFVTEVFICGSLSNISVYATALDAVRHGLAVTIVEDCVGYRIFARHEEAMRRMADMMGANGVTSEELIAEQDWEETEAAESAKPDISHIPADTGIGIEQDLDDLAVQPTSGLSPDLSQGGLSIDVDQPGDQDREEGQISSVKHSRLQSSSQMGDASTSRLRVRRQRMRRVNRDPRNYKPSSAQPGAPESSVSADAPAATPSPGLSTLKKPKSSHETFFGPGDSIGEGDSRIIYDLPLPANAFELLRKEVKWQKMYHLSGQVPRLVAVQGAVQPDNSVPIYRHPADESPPLLPFSSTVDMVRILVERFLGHPLNHVLIQLYRDGQDYISEHSDKTLDIVRGSYICNVSLGAQRVMALRTKASAKSSAMEAGLEDISTAGSGPQRQIQRIPLPHNSLFILGEATNTRWLHGIRADKRPNSIKTEEELAFRGERISLTFRHIGTFTHPETNTIWGQGALSKTKEKAGRVVHGEPAETERMIHAFGLQNRQTDFNWEEHYGQGFDAVNFVTAAATTLVSDRDEVADFRVRMCLVENGIRYNLASLDDVPSPIRDSLTMQQIDGGDMGPILIDPDAVTYIAGDIDILSHIAEQQQQQSLPEPSASGQPHPSRTLQERFHAIEELLSAWRVYQKDNSPEAISQQLSVFDAELSGRPYLAGQAFGVDDCAFWPVIRDIVRSQGSLDANSFPSLSHYYQKVGRRGCVRTVLDELQVDS